MKICLCFTDGQVHYKNRIVASQEFCCIWSMFTWNCWWFVWLILVATEWMNKRMSEWANAFYWTPMHVRRDTLIGIFTYDFFVLFIGILLLICCNSVNSSLFHWMSKLPKTLSDQIRVTLPASAEQEPKAQLLLFQHQNLTKQLITRKT